MLCSSNFCLKSLLITCVALIVGHEFCLVVIWDFAFVLLVMDFVLAGA